MATKKPEVKKPEPTKSTQVATQQAMAPVAGKVGVLVQSEVPEHLKASMASSRGSENVQTEDLVIPRLEVLQGLSKALEPGHASFINGAKQGDLINSVTRQVYGSKVHVVPVQFTKQFLVWKDIKKGGGFFGAFPDHAAATARANEEGGVGETTGIEIIDTPVHLCLLIDPNSGKAEEIMVSMPRTKAKVSRQWNSMIRLAGGDRFTRVYQIGSTLEDKSGQKYYNFTVAQSGFPNKALFMQAESLFKQVQAGKGRVMDVKDFQDNNIGEHETEM